MDTNQFKSEKNTSRRFIRPGDSAQVIADINILDPDQTQKHVGLDLWLKRFDNLILILQKVEEEKPHVLYNN